MTDKQKSKITLMTEGNIFKILLFFSIPLILGNFLQQMYSTVDSIIVGNYVGSQALAAVSSTSMIVTVIISGCQGIAVGAGVVIAQFFGAGNTCKMKRAIHNSIALTLVMGVVLTIVGLLFNDPILKAIGVPSEVFSEASTYLSIYFWSLIFVMVYNMGSGILRSVGDSKRPLYFLIFSSVVNIILDFLFVKYFHFGVAGAGYATLIAQAISAIMVMYVLMKTEDDYKVVLKEIGFDKEILLKIIKIGLPTGFQQSIVSLSNVIVQSYINVYGASVIAGYSVTIKIDGFVNLPLQAFNMAITTFVGQNIGAKQYDRVKKGAYITTALATLTIACFVVIMYFFGRDFIALFNQEKDVIDAGRLMQLTFLPFYIVLPINQVINGVLRGAGRSAVPMYVMIFSFVFLRQIYLFLITKVTSDIVYVFLGWPTTWVVCSLIFIIYFFKVQWLPQEKDA